MIKLYMLDTKRPKLNYGILFTKYTGSAKSGSNDASAETVGKIRRLFNDNGIVWQMGELGRLMQARRLLFQFVANLNIETIDCGVRFYLYCL